MINFRFHLVSLVAVFLALGVGVAMGASFIDRATVDTMRARVDDLETGFRERGDELGAREGQVRELDETSAALLDPSSRALRGPGPTGALVLEGDRVVVVAPDDVPSEAAQLIDDAMAAAGADVVGSLRLQSGLTPAGEDLVADEGERLERALGPVGLVGEDPVDSARIALAQALGWLSANPPGEGDTAEDGAGTTTVPDEGDAAATGVTSREEAAALLQRYVEEGLLSVDTGGLASESAFPAVGDVRYLVLTAVDTEPGPADWIVPFAEDYGDVAPQTMVVAAVGPVREAGSAPPEETDPDVDQLLEPLRTGPASTEVTTVDKATEALARLAVVYSLDALGEGIVGHYGMGPGAGSPFPPAAEE